MISPSNRALAVELIQEANQNGARLAKACEELHISVRTYERWVEDGDVKVIFQSVGQGTQGIESRDISKFTREIGYSKFLFKTACK